MDYLILLVILVLLSYLDDVCGVQQPDVDLRLGTRRMNDIPPCSWLAHIFHKKNNHNISKD